MTALTANGLPYPTASDYLASTNVYLNDLRTVGTYKLQNPRWVYGGGDVLPDASGNFTLTVPFFARVRGAHVQAVQTSNQQAVPIFTMVRSLNPDGAVVTAWYQQEYRIGYNVFPWTATLPIEYLIWGVPK